MSDPQTELDNYIEKCRAMHRSHVGPVPRFAHAVSSLADQLDACRDARASRDVEAANLEARLAEAERDMDQLIGERDHAQDMADKLADALATLLGVEIGEHSNMNCPWEQALEAFEERAASTVTQDAAP